MTYDVFGGMLNLALSIYLSISKSLTSLNPKSYQNRRKNNQLRANSDSVETAYLLENSK